MPSFVVFAQSTEIGCASNGYTVLTINGMLTNEVGAKSNMAALEDLLPLVLENEEVKVDYLYNPTHFEGLKDYLDVAIQKFFEESALNDHDADMMMVSLSEKLHTQKVLFVPHSQGNFYANDLYNKLADQEGGIPKSSMAIYGVATPASYVAGGGRWITSDTDSVIVGRVRDKFGRTIMEPNAHIVFDASTGSNGHGFADIYLGYEATRMIREIEMSMEQLQTNNIQDVNKPCVSRPYLSLGYFMEDRALITGDTFASLSVDIFQTAGAASKYVFGKAVDGVLLTSSSVKTTGLTLGGLAYDGSSWLADGIKDTGLAVGGMTYDTSAALAAGTKSTGLWIGDKLFAVTDTLGNAAKFVGLAIGDATYQMTSTISAKGSALLASVSGIFDQASSRATSTVSASTTMGSFNANTDVTSTSAFMNGFPTLVKNLQGVPGVARDAVAQTAPMNTTSLPTQTLEDLRQQLLRARVVLETLSGVLVRTSAVSAQAPSSTVGGVKTSTRSIAADVYRRPDEPGGIQTIPYTTPDEKTTIGTASTTSTSTDPIVSPPDITSPLPPVLNDPSLVEYATTTFTFSGTGEASTTLLVSWNEGAVSYVRIIPVLPVGTGAGSPNGVWEVTLTLPEGVTALLLVLRDDAGNVSSGVVHVVNITLPSPPAPLLYGAGVVINEISTNPGREYIELYNSTNDRVLLYGGMLFDPTDLTTVLLNGVIEPHGYYVVAAKNSTVTRFDERSELSRWFRSSGATIDLMLSGYMLDELPYCEHWCNSVNEYGVLERFSSSLPTSDYTGNWGVPLFFLSSMGESGTPGARNTLNYLLAMGNTITGSLHPVADEYVIDDRLTIVSDARLTLSAGTTILFYGDDAALLSEGVFETKGSTTSPVTITTFAPLFYGPTNNVDITLSGTVNISGTHFTDLENGLVLDHASSTLVNVDIRGSRAGIIATGGITTASDLSISRVTGDGVQLIENTAELSSTTIDHVNGPPFSEGVEVMFGSLIARDLSISNVYPSKGIQLSAASATIDNLTINQAWSGGVGINYETTATITDATITQTANGITVTGSSTLIIASSTVVDNIQGIGVFGSSLTGDALVVTDNDFGFYVSNDATVEVHDSTIEGNTQGVLNATPAPGANSVDMSENYWGSTNGPTLPGDMSGNAGDTVTVGVIVTPYLTDAPLGSQESSAGVSEGSLM